MASPSQNPHALKTSTKDSLQRPVKLTLASNENIGNLAHHLLDLPIFVNWSFELGSWSISDRVPGRGKLFAAPSRKALP
jgi:hypothetical protein